MCSGLETSTQNLELVEVELGSSRYKVFILVSTCNIDKMCVCLIASSVVQASFSFDKFCYIFNLKTFGLD